METEIALVTAIPWKVPARSVAVTKETLAAVIRILARNKSVTDSWLPVSAIMMAPPPISSIPQWEARLLAAT
jgi:hypothetical protein